MEISVTLAQIAYIDALQNLIVGFTLLGLALILFLVAWRIWRWHRKHQGEEVILVFLGLFMGGALLACSLIFLANIWNWQGISHPALYAAHEQIEAQNRPRPIL